MKAYLEIVELKNDIIATSPVEEECCDMNCPTDSDQMQGNY